jgi:PAN domain
MMRWFVALIVCCLLAASVFFPAPAVAQTGFDRPGSDYTNFVVRSGDPAACALRCEREGRCRAWTFSYPQANNVAAVCWLKNKVPPRVESTCCVSGVRGAAVREPKGGPIEFSIDRAGGDMRNFEVTPDTSGQACADACKADAKCRAWSYERPGYFGSAARCFLKDKVTAPRRRPCCISGVVR